jgi:hypothetical protein
MDLKKIVSLSNSTSTLSCDSPSIQRYEYFNSLRALDKFKLPEDGNILTESLLNFIQNIIKLYQESYKKMVFLKESTARSCHCARHIASCCSQL